MDQTNGILSVLPKELCTGTHQVIDYIIIPQARLTFDIHNNKINSQHNSIIIQSK